MNTTSPTPGPRLLLVDDNAAIHQDFRKILGGASSESPLQEFEEALFEKPKSTFQRVTFRVDSAYQGQEALQMVQQALAENDPYLLAFMDIRMPPGWDGVETIERIWQVYPDLQMVLCSAYSDYTWDDLINRFGHTDNLLILKKPFETVEVLQIAHALTKKWALAHQARLWMKDLDRLVRERTQELVATNEQLRTEIAERTKVQQSLRISEERFAKAFRTSPIPMAIINRSENRFLDGNESFFRLTGCAPEELLTHTALELNLWADYTIRKISGLESGQHLHNHPSSLRARNGTLHEVVVWAEPIVLDDCGACVLLIVEDVTDQLRLETQLRQAQKMEAVGRLAAGVAHEFNNILTVIQGHAELLRDPKIPSHQVAESSGRISQASQRAAALTRQLLTFSRQQPVQLKPLNLSNVVRSTQKMLRQLLGERYTLEFDCADALPLITADEGNMEQILINLSLNARDAMPDGGPIRIETNLATFTETTAAAHPDARSGRFVSVAVTDRGCGISSDILRRVFDPFFTTKDIGKGTGLGLSTIHGIVRQHQGWIEATSEIGRGSTFTIYLPVTTNAPLLTRSAKLDRDVAPPLGNGEAVLVVEDDPSVRDLARATLERGGYTVFEAEDGQRALEIWETAPTRITVLITDMVLPNGISGAKLAQLLAQRDPQLHLIYVSGYGSETLKAELPATFAPGVNFLSKPFDPHALLKAVTASLHRNPAAPQGNGLALV